MYRLFYEAFLYLRSSFFVEQPKTGIPGGNVAIHRRVVVAGVGHQMAS